MVVRGGSIVAKNLKGGRKKNGRKTPIGMDRERLMFGQNVVCVGISFQGDGMNYERPKLSFLGGPLQHGKLMPARENFRRELEPRADRGSKRGQQDDEQRSRTVSVSGPQPQRPQHVPNIQ
jgi:hypothetical protein